MKATVDPELCIGCGLCPSICPEVFDMDGDLAVVIVDEIPADVEDSAKDAADQCPVDAIKVQ